MLHELEAVATMQGSSENVRRSTFYIFNELLGAWLKRELVSADILSRSLLYLRALSELKLSQREIDGFSSLIKKHSISQPSFIWRAGEGACAAIWHTQLDTVADYGSRSHYVKFGFQILVVHGDRRG